MLCCRFVWREAPDGPGLADLRTVSLNGRMLLPLAVKQRVACRMITLRHKLKSGKW